MYSVLDKDMIEIEIVQFIPRGKRGFPPKSPLADIVNAILYKLKTGVQGHQLPVKALFSKGRQAGNRSITITGSGAYRGRGKIVVLSS